MFEISLIELGASIENPFKLEELFTLCKYSTVFANYIRECCLEQFQWEFFTMEFSSQIFVYVYITINI